MIPAVALRAGRQHTAVTAPADDVPRGNPRCRQVTTANDSAGTTAMPGYLSAVWFAGSSCSKPFYPSLNVPVWLVQHTFNHLDHDWAC